MKINPSKIIVCSNLEADKITRAPHVAFIKITDPRLGDDRARLYEPAECAGNKELTLRFYDVDQCRNKSLPPEISSRCAQTYHALRL